MRNAFIILLLTVHICSAQNIIQAEYYIDTDPGTGNGSPVSIGTPGDTVTQSLSIIVSGLAEGPHLLCIRTKNAAGIWSHQSSRTFYVSALPQLQQLVTGEYFFDADPGTGNGTSFAVTAPGNSISQQLALNTSGLSEGPHMLCIRTKNSSGTWSQQSSRSFYIYNFPSAEQVVSGEYFFNTDPGQGNGTPFTFQQGNNVNASFTITNPFASGQHDLVIRTKDSGGEWSHQLAERFNICTNYGANSDYTFFVDRRTVYFNNLSQYDTAFRWEFGDGTFTTVQRNPAHTYSAAGNYQVRLITYNNCATDTFMKIVPAAGLQFIYPSVSADTNIFSGYIKGIGFQPGCSVRLQKNGSPDIIPDTVIYGASTSVGVKFTFRHNPAGTYNVIAENPGGAVIDTLFNAFTLQPNIQRSLSVNYTGGYRARTGRSLQGKFSIENTGNTSLYFVPFFILFTGDTSFHMTVNTSFTLDTTVAAAIAAIIPPAHAYNIDDPANPAAVGGQRIIAGVITQIGPGESQNISVNGQSFSPGCQKVKIKVGEPLDNWFLNPYSNSCDFLPKELKCAMDIIGLIPAAGCVVGVAGWACSADKMLSNWAITGKTGDSKWDFIASTATTALQCVPGVSTVQGAMRIAVDMAQDFANGGALIGDCMPNPPDKRPEKEIEVCWSNSYDPNEKTGPQGITADNFINKYQAVNYTIKFENIDSATAPAAMVTVSDTVDVSTYDMSSFRLKGFAIGDSVYSVPDEFSFSYVTDLDLRATKGIWLRVNAHADTSTGIVSWKFISYDSLTYEEVTNPLLGFLPPNVQPPEGEGWISFSVKPKSSLAHDDVIQNNSSIVFDNNSPVLTNTWINTIDTIKPTSTVQPLTAVQQDTLFQVITSGSDADAGILNYIIYASINDSAFKAVHFGAPDTFMFKGIPSYQYEFFSQARDRADNFEDTVHVPDAVTVVAVGIEEDATQYSFSVFPNPSSLSVNIYIQSALNQVLEMELYNMQGALQRKWMQSTNETKNLQLTSLKAGLYYLKAETASKVYLIKKVIVLR